MVGNLDIWWQKGNVSAEKLVKIQIPSTLKKQLVDDWEFITQQNKVHICRIMTRFICLIKLSNRLRHKWMTTTTTTTTLPKQVTVTTIQWEVPSCWPISCLFLQLIENSWNKLARDLYWNWTYSGHKNITLDCSFLSSSVSWRGTSMILS